MISVFIYGAEIILKFRYSGVKVVFLRGLHGTPFKKTRLCTAVILYCSMHNIICYYM